MLIQTLPKAFDPSSGEQMGHGDLTDYTAACVAAAT